VTAQSIHASNVGRRALSNSRYCFHRGRRIRQLFRERLLPLWRNTTGPAAEKGHQMLVNDRPFALTAVLRERAPYPQRHGSLLSTYISTRHRFGSLFCMVRRAKPPTAEQIVNPLAFRRIMQSEDRKQAPIEGQRTSEGREAALRKPA
jgi:hypothetical protein